jgi:hypothetical protein
MLTSSPSLLSFLFSSRVWGDFVIAESLDPLRCCPGALGGVGVEETAALEARLHFGPVDGVRLGLCGSLFVHATLHLSRRVLKSV